MGQGISHELDSMFISEPPKSLRWWRLFRRDRSACYKYMDPMTLRNTQHNRSDVRPPVVLRSLLLDQLIAELRESVTNSQSSRSSDEYNDADTSGAEEHVRMLMQMRQELYSTGGVSQEWRDQLSSELMERLDFVALCAYKSNDYGVGDSFERFMNHRAPFPPLLCLPAPPPPAAATMRPRSLTEPSSPCFSNVSSSADQRRSGNGSGAALNVSFCETIRVREYSAAGQHDDGAHDAVPHKADSLRAVQLVLTDEASLASDEVHPSSPLPTSPRPLLWRLRILRSGGRGSLLRRALWRRASASAAQAPA